MTTHFNVTNLPHLHCRFDFDWSTDLFPFLEIMVSCMVTFYGPQVTQANEEPPPKSSLDLTLTHNILMMKNLKFKRCAFILKLNPFEPGTIISLWTLTPWWSCCKSTSLLVTNLKLSMKVVTKLKILLSSHGLQFLALDTIVSCVI
jgi:hypothetical protein